jgi:hypothetical protein
VQDNSRGVDDRAQAFSIEIMELPCECILQSPASWLISFVTPSLKAFLNEAFSQWPWNAQMLRLVQEIIHRWQVSVVALGCLHEFRFLLMPIKNQCRVRGVGERLHSHPI